MNLKYILYILPFRFLDYLLYLTYTIVVSKISNAFILGFFYFYLAILGVILPIYLKRKELHEEYLLKTSSILLLLSSILLYSYNIFLIFLSASLWIFSAYYHFLAFYKEERERMYIIYEMLTRLGWLLAGIIGFFILKIYNIKALFDSLLIISLINLFIFLIHKKESITNYLEEMGELLDRPLLSIKKFHIHVWKPHLIIYPIKIDKRKLIIDARGFLATFGSAIFFTGINYYVVKSFGGDILFLANTLSLLVNTIVFEALTKVHLSKFLYIFAALIRGIAKFLLLSFILIFDNIYAYLLVCIIAGCTWPIYLMYDNLEITKRFGKEEIGSLAAFRSIGTSLGSFIGGYLFLSYPLSVGIVSFINYLILSILLFKSKY